MFASDGLLKDKRAFPYDMFCLLTRCTARTTQRTPNAAKTLWSAEQETTVAIPQYIKRVYTVTIPYYHR